MIKITNNKKLNRIDRLSDYREVKLPLNRFKIEVSERAYKKLEEVNRIHFNVCHDFDTNLYWLVVNHEGSDKHFDFTYLMTGELNTRVDGFEMGKMICVDFDHIDVATEWGLIQSVMELLARWLDKNYGQDCGFKDNYKYKGLDYAVNKPNVKSK